MDFTRRVSLAPVEAEHYSFIYRLLVGTEFGWRYRFRGTTPNPDAVISALWDGVLAQYLVVGRDTARILGLVQLYGYNSRGRHAYAACIATPDAQGTGLVMEGLAALLQHGFRVFSLDKIYFEALDFNLQAFSSITRYCEQEARLVRHEMNDGVWSDLLTFALYRTTWDADIRPRLGRLFSEM